MENVHGLVVLLHPVAAMTIVDSHEHKKETQHRVIGTVLGGREKGVVEVRGRMWTTLNRVQPTATNRSLMFFVYQKHD